MSEDPASSEDRSRAHLFRERLALREHPLPDGPAPSSWLRVPKSPDFQPRLASPDVGSYSLFAKLRCDGSSSCGCCSAERAVLLEGRVGATSSGPSRGRLRAQRFAAEPQRRAPARPRARVARPCRNGPRNHGDPSSGSSWSLATSKSGASGTSPRVPSAPKGFLSGTRLRVPRREQATSCKDTCASSLLDDFCSDLRVRRVREHPQTFGQHGTYGGSSRDSAHVMIVASRGPGASALRRAGALGTRGEMPSPRLNSSQATPCGPLAPHPVCTISCNLETRFPFEEWSRGRGPEFAATQGHSLPQSPGSLVARYRTGYVWPGCLRLILFG